MLIDGQRVQARLAPTVRMITVGPSDSVAELKLPVSSKELQQGVENAIHLELHEHFSDDQLKQLYSECEKRGLIGHSSVDFRRMLVPHDAPEFPHRHDRR
jgi:hypothetical protein